MSPPSSRPSPPPQPGTQPGLPPPTAAFPPLVAQLYDPLRGTATVNPAAAAAALAKAQQEARLREPGQEQDGKTSLNVVEGHTAHFRENPVGWISQAWAYSQGTGWRGYDSYLGAPILYAGSSQESIRSVLGSDAVKQRIRALAAKRVDQLLAKEELALAAEEAKSTVAVSIGAEDDPSNETETQIRSAAAAASISSSSSSSSSGKRTSAWLAYDALLPSSSSSASSSSHPNETRAQRARRHLKAYKAQKRAELELQLTDVARAMIEKSVARLDSMPFIRAFAAAMNNVLLRMYHQGIHVSVPQVLELRRVAAYAAERKESIIFLPCHKSHIDYLTVSWLMYRLGIALPHIIAGENLDIPVVGDILRGGGAFFIRRTFAGDQLYPVVIREYIEQLLSAGKNLECFIEGTRSRTGKLLPPKIGILKYILEGYLAGRTTDVWICPVSLQYDGVIESETYVSELLGKPKEQESLLGLLSGSSSVLQLKMGRIDIRFKTPWSLKGFLQEQVERRTAPPPVSVDLAHMPWRNAVDAAPGATSGGPPAASTTPPTLSPSPASSSSSSPTPTPPTTTLPTRVAHKGKESRVLDVKNSEQDKVTVLKALGYQVLSDINSISVVMPAALVGTVILILRGRGIGRSELIRRVDWLRDIIIARGYTVADFGNMTTAEVVDRALGLMKGLITEHTREVMEPTYEPEKHFELSFYRNQVLHIFVSESLIAVTLYTAIKKSSDNFMTFAELVRECSFISTLLRNEFVFGTESLEVNLVNTVQSMEREGVLEIRNPPEGRGQEHGTVGISERERKGGRENFDAFLFLVWPFVEGYWLAACSLLYLAPPMPEGKSEETDIPWFAAKDFEKLAQLFGKTLYAQGELSYLEAVNQATLAQAIARYQERGMIIRAKSTSAKPIPLVALNPEFRPSYNSNTGELEGRLWTFLEHLASFRREGKERRDQVVGARIMALIQESYPPVIEWSRKNTEGKL
ncbi:hypothetical protein OC846_004701 [Tilletia horrida]|uniref:Phospholipid/glycerol acyltransferase domain-containing protein n=1 Tax=Tilletia horrida TaxID=155126 RepID=A0AAN6GPV9_9BASI|nr:hypothetical protein OC845_004988 [Tilletia horrida]KAK0547878.1 hypothetical protein OC846_004701 [Tilletia horrida]KAK0560744.1 hypothetical protein OC861_006144 [Tilletia horrida]